METLFLVCAILGGAVLIVQLGLSMFGFGDDILEATEALETADALDLLSARSVTAGVAFFGIGGLATLAAGLGPLIALLVAVIIGFGAMVGVAALMRSFLRLQSDGTIQMDRAIGQPGTVYLRIPGERAGVGRVLLTVQDRTVECQAVTALNELPTGTPIVVVDILGPDTVEVAPAPTLGGILNAPS